MKQKKFPVFFIRILLVSFFLGIVLSLNAQNEIKGKVIDSKGSPIPFASVLIKGTSIGTTTDEDGNYNLTIPATEKDPKLEFKFIGYRDKEEEVGSRTTINTTMEEDVNRLDELVVIGYGVQKKSVVTAAISSIKSEDLERLAPSRIENVLKGQVSGVQITSNSGQPGADVKVRIRGTGTINNSDPLYIVDGMPIDGGIRNINPMDIASVEILKDAASAAVYGSRAANGVILVTTKSGIKGKATITYDVEYGLQNPWRKKSVLNAEQYMILRNEMTLNGGERPIYSNEEINNARNGLTANTDWQDEVFNRNAPMVNHQIGISGGNDKLTYFLSLGRFSQDGIVGGNLGVSNYDRWTVRANNTYEVLNATQERDFLNKLKVGMNASYGRANFIGAPGGTNSEFGSVLGSAIGLTPLMSVYASDKEAQDILAKHPFAVRDGNDRVFQTSPAGFQEIVNPVALMYRPDREYNNEDKFIGNFFAELDILKDLKFKSAYGFDLAFWGKDGYKYPYYLSDITQVKKESQSSAWSEMNRSYTWQVENTLTYSFNLESVHNFTVLLGQSAMKTQSRVLGGSAFDLLAYDPNKSVIDMSIGDKNDQRTYGSTKVSTLASYFARVDYNFEEKYMAQFTLRRDGSDKFGPNNKWGTFPSISVGWNILNENFISEVKPHWLDFAKLRLSWGVNGNQNIEANAYASYLNGNQNYYFGTGDEENMIYGLSPGRIANPNLKWEESRQTNLGLDLRFFSNALSFSFDYFKKRTVGMLALLPIPMYNGVEKPYFNAGKMNNSGVEFEVGYRFSVTEFNFGIHANASYVRNTMIDYGNATGEDQWGGSGALGVDNFIFGRNGMVYPFFYGWKTDGILQNQQEADAYNTAFGTNALPGDVRFANLNGDNTIDGNDRTMIGKGAPNWTYGITLNADWREFDFTMLLQGMFGNDIFDISQRADVPGINRPTWMLERWTGPGTSNRIPRVTTKDENRNWRASDLYIKNGAFMRLKSMQIGYTLPAHLSKKAGIERVRVFIGGENLLTFTKYKGFDPEISEGNQGVDKGIYPQSRIVSFGANISF